MYDKHLSAEKKLSKARTQLVMDDAFFGSISMRMAIIEDIWGVLPDKTMGTDGKQIIWNREFIDDLAVSETKYLLAHEVGHVIFKHPIRRKGRDFDLWNQACDQVVDLILESANYDIRDEFKASHDPVFKDKSAEEVYRIMLANAKQKNSGKSGQPGPPGPPGPSGGTSGKPGNTPSPQQGTGQYKIPQTQAAAKAAAPIPQVSPKVHGLVFDAPIDLKDKKSVKQAEEDIDIAIESAAKFAGSLPAALSTLVTANKEHKINYTVLLREFLETNLIPGDYDWQRPDRSYTTLGIFLPGICEEEELPKIIFACDASGSVGPAEKKAYANEISGILEEFPCIINAIYFDTKVSNLQELSYEDFPIKLEFKGGGGTDFAPVFRYIKDEGIDAKAVLFFTDMQTMGFGEDPGIPVLWMNTFRPADNMKIPFGRMIKLELDGYTQGQI